MRFTRILLALLIAFPLVYSCQADIEDLADPRDAIVKQWEITELQTGGISGYWVTIKKDATETTRVLFDNFHNLDYSETLYATLSGSTLTIPEQAVNGGVDKIAGTGVISGDLKTIRFEYTYEENNDGTNNIIASFGDVVVTKKKKMKSRKEL